MKEIRLALIFLTLLTTYGALGKDAYTTLITYQTKQRISAGIGESQYHLLPFRLSGQSQHFIQAPLANESISAEVVVHWITSNSSLAFPSFDLTQKVRLVIQEETYIAAPTTSILTKQFLTQTGFKINLIGGRRYRWRIESAAKVTKLVEIAIVSKPQHQMLAAQSAVKTHYEEVELLRQMTQTLQRMKTIRSRRQQKQEKSSVEQMWAWMSGMQMISLLGVLLVQLTLFQKFVMPHSVV